jgi:hypothetical protein
LQLKCLLLMDLDLLLEKIHINFLFSPFEIMLKHKLDNKDLFYFITKNFGEKLINNIIFESYVSFIKWIEIYLNENEKINFYKLITSNLLTLLKQDFSIFKFFRIVNVLCITINKRTVLTDNMHFELISILDKNYKYTIDTFNNDNDNNRSQGNLEAKAYTVIFCELIKNFGNDLNKIYLKNLVEFLIDKIMIEDLDFLDHKTILIDFYFILNELDLTIFKDSEKFLNKYNNIINYFENSNDIKYDLNNFIKISYKIVAKNFLKVKRYKFLKNFLDLIEKRVINGDLLIDIDIPRYMIFYCMLIEKNGLNNKDMMIQCCEIADLIYEKDKKCMTFNLIETISSLEILLNYDIVCKSLIKNFLINIQIYKKIKLFEKVDLDDQATIDFNTLNNKSLNFNLSKYNIEKILFTLRKMEIINENVLKVIMDDLFN